MRRLAAGSALSWSRLAVFAVAIAASAPAAGSMLAPITKGPYAQHVTDTSAVVHVEVDPPVPATLELGDAAAPGKIESKQALAFHAFRLTGLEPGRRYPYTVRAGGAVRQGAFTTAPKPGDAAELRFLIYGDNRSDDAAHAAVVRAMVPKKTDFLLHTGDFVEDGSDPSQWQTFFDTEAPLLADRAFFSCVGNHELTDRSGALYLRYFGPFLEIDPDAGVKKPRLYGTFRWGSARFFMLNAMDDWAKSDEKAWLKGELEKAAKEEGLVWRFAVMHHSPWSSGPHGRNSRMHDAGVVQMLRDAKIDLFVGGHDHIYERGDADGARYVVTGGGGAPTYEIKNRIMFSRKSESTRHFIEAQVSKERVRLVATRLDGSTLDGCGFTQGQAGWDCDAPSPDFDAGGKPVVGPTPTPTTTPSRPPSSCGCEIPGGARAPGSVSAGAALGVALLLAARRQKRLRSWS